MDNIINNVYDEPVENFLEKNDEVCSKEPLDTENTSQENDDDPIDTSWIQESERYHHISDDQERELMNSIGFYFIYINKHDYIEKILFENNILEIDTDNGFSFLSKETILKIIQNKKISTPTSKYKLIDILSFVVDIEPNKVKDFLDMDTFDSDLEKIFLKVLPIFNDIHIDKSIFVFHSINHLYFIFKEVQYSPNHRTTLKSIMKHNKNIDNQTIPVAKHPSELLVEGFQPSDQTLPIANPPSLDVLHKSLIKSTDNDNIEPSAENLQQERELDSIEGFSEPRSGIEKPRSAIDVTDRRSVKSTDDELQANTLQTDTYMNDDKPTNKGTKKVRIVDNIRELRKLSNKGRFTRKVF